MDFVEIDRNMLQNIGFKNIFNEHKDKNGNLKLKDSRNDFKCAIKSLRRFHGYVEGTSFEDPNAHFLVKKLKISPKQRGGHNKQSIWVREDMLEKWIEFSKHSCSFRKRNGKGLVYFIHEEGKFNRFKIGYTTNLEERLLSLQIGNPDLLVVYKTFENVIQRKETELHQMFAQYHIRGEWFAISTDMIDSIENMF